MSTKLQKCMQQKLSVALTKKFQQKMCIYTAHPYRSSTGHIICKWSFCPLTCHLCMYPVLCTSGFEGKIVELFKEKFATPDYREQVVY